MKNQQIRDETHGVGFYSGLYLGSVTMLLIIIGAYGISGGANLLAIVQTLRAERPRPTDQSGDANGSGNSANPSH